ncbi:hypothetical protein KCU93_g180, partial [Aureobasidium melanogenum]
MGNGADDQMVQVGPASDFNQKIGFCLIASLDFSLDDCLDAIKAALVHCTNVLCNSASEDHLDVLFELELATLLEHRECLGKLERELSGLDYFLGSLGWRGDVCEASKHVKELFGEEGVVVEVAHRGLEDDTRDITIQGR